LSNQGKTDDFGGMEDNNEEWERIKPVIQKLGEKMLKAKWVYQFRIDSDGVHALRTPLGQRRIKQLWGILKELEPQTICVDELGLLFLFTRKEARRLGWK
jgi:hypothetical protein